MDPRLQVQLPDRDAPAEEVSDHQVETAGIQHADHVFQTGGRRDAVHTSRAGFGGADAAHDADAVGLDRIPALDLETQRRGEYRRLDVVDRRRYLHQRGVVAGEVGDPVDLAVEFARAAECQRALAGHILERDDDVQAAIDRSQDFSADILVRDVGYSRQPDDRLRMGWDAGQKDRYAGQQ